MATVSWRTAYGREDLPRTDCRSPSGCAALRPRLRFGSGTATSERWEEFRKKLRAELAKSPRKELLEGLIERARREKVTLVFAARDAERCNATVIAELMRERL